MGEVYLAEDSLLGRRVAIKRPGPAFADSPETLARVRREARNAAVLSHPGIASIHDVLDVDGQSYIVMEYIEGTDLSVLLREGPLDVKEALRIGIAVAEALAAAHAQGIVHRDLKPANVRMTPSGQVKVLDFGLSKAEAQTDGEALTAMTPVITRVGEVVGTPGYMAPEQLLGQRTDARTDVFSLGAMLYELLTGRPPFEGGDAFARSLAVLSDLPPRAADGNPRVPPELDDLLARAMARKPLERIASAEEFAAALGAIRTALGDEAESDRVQRAASSSTPHTAATGVPKAKGPRLRTTVLAVAAAAVLGLAVVTVTMFENRVDRAQETQVGRAVPVVAVLTPKNLSGDPANDFLAVGLADSLFTDLSALPDVTVVPPSDVAYVKYVKDEAGQERGEPRALARGLGASLLVDSSVQRVGDLVKVNARVVSASGAVVWQNTYETKMSGIFGLQRQLSEGVAGGLRLQLRPEDRGRFGPHSTASVEALTDYWRGRTLLERKDLPSNVDGAIAAFQAAIEKDGNLAEAHAGLGEAYWERYKQTNDADLASRAVEASEDALRLDPSQTRVWITLALVHHGTGQSERALSDLHRAIELEPNGDDAFRRMAQVLSDQGQTDDALNAIDNAIERRPGFWRNHYIRGLVLYRAGRFEEAKKSFESVIRLQPDSASGYQALGTVMQASGDLDGARQTYEQALKVGPSPNAYGNLGTIYYWQGRYKDAVRAYKESIRLAPRDALYRRNLGDAYTRLKQTANARESYGVAVSLLEQELEVNPKDTEVLGDLAVCEMKLGLTGRAQGHIAKALELAPDEGSVLYSQAVVMALSGRAREAMRIVQRAVEQGTSLQVVERDDDLEAMRALPEYAAWFERTQHEEGRGSE